MTTFFQLYSDQTPAEPRLRESEPDYFRRIAADRSRQVRAERRRRIVRTLTGRRPLRRAA